MRATNESGADTEAVPRAVGRVLDLLEIVLAEKSCTLTTAASASDLTPTTALRHLRALEARAICTETPPACSPPGRRCSGSRRRWETTGRWIV